MSRSLGWLAAASVMAVLPPPLSGCGGGFVSEQSVAVPDVVGVKGDEAIRRICAAGLVPAPLPPPTPEERAQAAKTGWTAFTPWKIADRPVESQSPAAGATVPRDSDVLLHVTSPYTHESVQLTDPCP